MFKDGGNEVLTLVLKRFSGVDFRAQDVTIADQKLELAVRFRDGGSHRHSLLKNSDSLHGVEIVKNHSSTASHRNHFADFVRVRPAHVNVSNHSVRVTEGDEEIGRAH